MCIYKESFSENKPKNELIFHKIFVHSYHMLKCVSHIQLAGVGASYSSQTNWELCKRNFIKIAAWHTSPEQYNIIIYNFFIFFMNVNYCLSLRNERDLKIPLPLRFRASGLGSPCFMLISNSIPFPTGTHLDSSDASTK